LIRTFDTPIITQDQSIDRVLAAGLPVALVFLEGTAPQDLDEEMKRIAREESGKLLVAMVFSKDSPQSVKKYQVSRFPAVVTVRDRAEISKGEGISADQFRQHVAFLLGKGPKPVEPAAAYRYSSQAGRPFETKSAAGVPEVVTDATFEQEVMRSPIPVIVDFWAPWCGPCKMVAPVLDKMAAEWAGKVKVAKVNVDENPQLSMKYGIQAIPTMFVVKNGQIVDRWAGALPEPMMRKRITPLVTS